MVYGVRMVWSLGPAPPAYTDHEAVMKAVAGDPGRTAGKPCQIP